MRSSIYTPSPRRALTPHKYFTRANTNPVSPSNSDTPQPVDRRFTPPNFLSSRPNLLNRDYTDDEEELDEDEFEPVPTSTTPSRLSPWLFLYNVLHWIGLTFLSINVYLLSVLKGITHWRHPFSDGFYNPFSKETDTTPSSTPRVDGSAGYTLRDGPIRSPSTTTTTTPTRTGWCGYLAGALFLLLLTYLLTIILVPFVGVPRPATTSTHDTTHVDMFSYLEEQRVLAGKLERLEVTTAQQLTLIQKLQEEGDVEGELVRLRSMTDKHSTDLGGIAATIAAYHASVKTLESGQTKLRTDYTSLASKLSSLTSTAASKADLVALEEGQAALKDSQVAMAGQVENLRTVITVLTSSVDSVGKRHDELVQSQKSTESDLQKVTAGVTTLDNSVKGLSSELADREKKMDVTIEGLNRRIGDLQREIQGLQGERPSLVQAAAVEDKLATLRKELLVTISNAQLAAASGNDEVLTSRLTELKSLMKEQEDAGQAIRATLSAAEQRIRALERKDTDLQLDQLTKARDETNAQIADLRSKLDVLSRSGRDSEERANANIRELKALIEAAKIEAAKQSRQVVLSVLSDVTRESSETRYFSEWLVARFLLKEELNYHRESSAPPPVVANETTVLPSQDELIQVILAELRSKHQIDLRPETGVTLSDIRVIVSDALQTFDEDKTGRADFALEALGGSVLSTGCTETYYEGAPYASFMSLPLYRVPNPPNVALQPGITPGQCWAFKGTEGYMMIKLAHAVLIDGVSMEHLPRRLSLNNDISSAPRRFSIRGLSHPEDTKSHHFGQFMYSDTGPALQHFKIKSSTPVAYEIVELYIESNHGNPEYTCLYRIRIHGKVLKLT